MKFNINGPNGPRDVKIGKWTPHAQANGATRDLSINDFKGTMIRWGDQLSLKVGAATHGPFKYVYELVHMFAVLEANR